MAADVRTSIEATAAVQAPARRPTSRRREVRRTEARAGPPAPGSDVDQDVVDYHDNASACRQLATKMPPAQREQLMDMASEWDQIAEDREDAIDTLSGIADPPPSKGIP